ncbi:MAG: low affinity iron permease family protein [Candidatus Omnitrophica bacterium]|nr:low affinity iron permease family protein [Candidatus Omnitrophota bacterium]
MLYRGNRFSKLATKIAHVTGLPATGVAALLLILIWVVTGPIFHFNNTWQLVISTITNIVTFLVVFLIQNTQNRDNYATQLKLDELIRAVDGAHNSLLDIEELTEDDLLVIKKRYSELAREAREKLRRGKKDTGTPSVESDE